MDSASDLAGDSSMVSSVAASPSGAFANCGIRLRQYVVAERYAKAIEPPIVRNPVNDETTLIR